MLVFCSPVSWVLSVVLVLLVVVLLLVLSVVLVTSLEEVFVSSLLLD
ncbi:hypothetical protein BAZSYMA_ACONTIG00454_2 [Bathymodiolus azoricus thioautotrophic gill symbiont]|uniref:Uncharacterized protein n=1 Tax=Bathymodiolus azoricus thioautotrophic gill symbiont TaxID=235205 RepID=A0A1H6JRS6_9GAMM|nr:hypothetical protein BAZSYMA_ACONTIG00454_2 [Bathymodiolus azoricus thioautotrophic gill symbiont]